MNGYVYFILIGSYAVLFLHSVYIFTTFIS